MADEAPKNAENPGSSDLRTIVRTIRHLAAVMSQHDLTVLDLENDGWRLRLRRGSRSLTLSHTPQLSLAPAQPTAPAAPSASAPAAAAPAPAANSKLHEIKSPTPGTFYTAANPGAEPFVRVGSRVTPTTVVGIIEAMKLFNEITADCSGVIKEILAENQQPVEYGQVLFRVDPAG